MKVCTMKMFYQLLFLFVGITISECEEHRYAHGAFGKAHLRLEMPSPYDCNRPIGLLSNSQSISISELKVSSTNYSNGGTIDVSWSPSTSSPCIDDFIGVYFVEVPIETGKHEYRSMKNRFDEFYSFEKVLVIMLITNLSKHIKIIHHGLWSIFVDP